MSVLAVAVVLSGLAFAETPIVLDLSSNAAWGRSLDQLTHTLSQGENEAFMHAMIYYLSKLTPAQPDGKSGLAAAYELSDDQQRQILYPVMNGKTALDVVLGARDGR
ncbi:MAG: hypothetical protein ACTHJQ_10090 [Rhizobiaceae bacterium]